MLSKRKTGTGGGVTKKLKCAIDFKEKLRIIHLYQNGKTVPTIARELNRPLSTVKTILISKDRIIENTRGAATLRGTILRKARSGAISEMEKLLIYWIEDMAQKKIAFTPRNIREKAKSLHTDLLANANRVDEDDLFKASAGWLERFRKRWNLQNIPSAGELLPADESEAVTFHDRLNEIIADGDYAPEQIFNVTETILYWTKLSPPIVTEHDELPEPGCKSAEEKLTIMLGANSSGDLKLKLVAVNHTQNPVAFENIDSSMLPVIWKTSVIGRTTRTLFEEWFNEHFIPEVKEYCLGKGIPFKILLVLDNYPSHTTIPCHTDVQVVFLPPRTASLIQPMDQGVTATFKIVYLQQTLAQAVKGIRNEEIATLEDFWIAYNILDAIKNIVMAWDQITERTLNVAWKKILLGTDLLVSASTDLEQMQYATDDCVILAERLQIDLDRDDINQIISHCDGPITNDELIAMTSNVEVLESIIEEDHKYDVPLSPSPIPRKQFTVQGLADAFQLLEEALTIFEEMDDNVDRFENVRRRVQTHVAVYKTIHDDMIDADYLPVQQKKTPLD